MVKACLCAARSRGVQKVFWEGIYLFRPFRQVQTGLLYVVCTLGRYAVQIPPDFELSSSHSFCTSLILKDHALIDLVSVLLGLCLLKIY
jgi:hypothetical protein